MTVITGMTVPFSFSEYGGVSVADPLLKIKNNIQTILRTQLKSRVMEPNYGSLFANMIGEMNDSTTRTILIKEVTEKLSLFEKNIKLLSVDAATENTSIVVTLRYKIISFDITDEILVKI